MTKNELRSNIEEMIALATKTRETGDWIAKSICPEGDDALYDLLFEIQEGSRTDVEETMTDIAELGIDLEDSDGAHEDAQHGTIGNNRLMVETPMGTLIAEPAGDMDHPGIWLSIKKGRTEDSFLLAEYCSDEYNSTAVGEEKESIMLRVYEQREDGYAAEEPNYPIAYWNS